MKRKRLVREAITHVLDQAEPTPVFVEDSQVWSDPTGVIRSGNSGHLMLMTGREQRGRQCGYWFRNSYRCVPTEGNSLRACDPDRPEMVWIAEDTLIREGGLGGVFDVQAAGAGIRPRDAGMGGH